MKGNHTMSGEVFSLFAKEGGRVGSGALGAGRGAIGACRPMCR
jgi:hypothetical protein